MNDLWENVFRVLAIFGLVALNGFFVAAEFALVSVRRTRIDELSKEGNRQARAVQRALAQLDIYVAAIQLGVTMASLGLGMCEPFIAELLEPFFRSFLPRSGAFFTSHGAALTLTFALITATHIIFGELAPKNIALYRADRVVLWVTPPLNLFLRIFKPFIVVLNTLGNAVIRLLGSQPASEHGSVHSGEEVKMIVRSSRQAGLLKRRQELWVAGVVDFEDTIARKLMTPRPDITAVEADVEASELLQIVCDSGHSRLPVYDDDLDNIVGVLHVKDVLAQLARGETDIDLRALARPPYFVPESKRAGDLLAEMRRNKTHMAIVQDEYGTVIGVVTVEDLLEEIVGEIQDEHDREEPLVQVVDERTTILDGKMGLSDVNERLNLELPEDAADTLGGYVFGLLGHVAKVGEQTEAEGVRFVVEALDGRRITKVRLIREPQLPEESESEPEEPVEEDDYAVVETPDQEDSSTRTGR